MRHNGWKLAVFAGLLALAAARPAAGGLFDWLEKDEDKDEKDRADRRQIHKEDRAEYTIMLKLFGGPQHVRQAKRFKAETKQATRWRELFIVHGKTSSTLYWGRHDESSDAVKNLKRARQFKTSAGFRIYEQARITTVPGVNPGPPEWELPKAQGAYSVVVAIFHNVETLDVFDEKKEEFVEKEIHYYTRKQDAAAYCRELRAQGEEAYYHHGPAQSAVTVGSFPEGSIIMTGGAVRRPEIRDPRIKRLIAKYEFLAVNGQKQIETVATLNSREAKRKAAQPYPVHVPHEEDARPGVDRPARMGNPGFGIP
jgi:hypothetical protein